MSGRMAVARVGMRLMIYEGKTSKRAISEALTTQYVKASGQTEILLQGNRIGQVVRHGKKGYIRKTRNDFAPTVYSSRIVFEGTSITEEAASQTSLLNKVAGRLSILLKAKIDLTDDSEANESLDDRTASKMAP